MVFIVKQSIILYQGVIMKVLLVHDSKFGNGEKVAKSIVKAFDGAEIKSVHNTKIKAKEALEFSPDVLIIGNAVRMFRMSRSAKSWLKKFNRMLVKEKRVIPFGICFITHMRPIEKIERHLIKFHNYMMRLGSINIVYPEYILAQVEDIEGPLKSGVLTEIEEQSSVLVKWIDDNTITIDN